MTELVRAIAILGSVWLLALVVFCLLVGAWFHIDRRHAKYRDPEPPAGDGHDDATGRTTWHLGTR